MQKFQFLNKTLQLNNLKTRVVMNAKILIYKQNFTAQ